MAELKEYEPALNVLVTKDYAAEEIVFPVFGEQGAWQEETVGRHTPLVAEAHQNTTTSVEDIRSRIQVED